MASAGAPGDDLSELAARAAGGDRLAVEQLAAHLDPMMVRYCRARIGWTAGGFEVADDIAQEACLGVYTALPGYHGKDHPFKPLAYRIAANKVADYYRRQVANRSILMEDPPEWGDSEPYPETVALDRELREHTQALLGILSDSQREIIILRVMWGMSAKDTAQAVDSTPGAVRVAQHKALTKLRTVLGISQPGALEHEIAPDGQGGANHPGR